MPRAVMTFVTAELHVAHGPTLPDLSTPIGERISVAQTGFAGDLWLDITNLRTIEPGSSRFQLRLRREGRPGFAVLGSFATTGGTTLGMSLEVPFDGPGIYIVELFDGGGDRVAWERLFEVVP